MKVKQTLSFDGMGKWFEDEIIFEGTKSECLVFMLEKAKEVKEEYLKNYEVDFVGITPIDDITLLVIGFSIQYIDDAITCKLEIVD